ncbi:MAG: 4'-phosphopantetheinyl transferase superfamily protein [Mycoplasma sp.]
MNLKKLKKSNNSTLDEIVHGIDVISIKRIEFKNTELIKKFLHKSEIEIFNKISNEVEAIHFLASRWAIKEAIFKCLNTKCPMNKIQLSKVGSQYFYIHNSYNFKISISYHDELVFASVIGWKK